MHVLEHAAERKCKSSEYMNLYFKVKWFYTQYVANIEPYTNQVPEYPMWVNFMYQSNRTGSYAFWIKKKQFCRIAGFGTCSDFVWLRVRDVLKHIYQILQLENCVVRVTSATVHGRNRQTLRRLHLKFTLLLVLNICWLRKAYTYSENEDWVIC